jgi:hypothetical protein
MIIGKDPDPYLGLVDPDPDQIGPKTYGSGSRTLLKGKNYAVLPHCLSCAVADPVSNLGNAKGGVWARIQRRTEQEIS